MNSVSIDNVISKIIRDTRLPDSSYVTDMYEWIPEAMRLLKTQAPMIPMAYPVKINFHVGHLPCGVLDIEAVEYCGKRLRYYKGVRTPDRIKGNTLPENQPFQTVFTTNMINGTPNPDSTLTPPTETHETAKYDLYMDHIRTTFPDGEVIIYANVMAHDSRGLPLIPDHADYKEAIYWYVRSKLIQSGYSDPMYGNRDEPAWQRFELHASRAIGDIRYPSVDEKEAQLAAHVRFVPPVDYYDSFFNTHHGEGLIGGDL